MPWIDIPRWSPCQIKKKRQLRRGYSEGPDQAILRALEQRVVLVVKKFMVNHQRINMIKVTELPARSMQIRVVNAFIFSLPDSRK